MATWARGRPSGFGGMEGDWSPGDDGLRAWRNALERFALRCTACLFCFLIACAACRSGEYVRVGALSPESTEEELTRDYTWRHISPQAKQQPLVRAGSLSSCVLRTRR